MAGVTEGRSGLRAVAIYCVWPRLSLIEHLAQAWLRDLLHRWVFKPHTVHPSQHLQDSALVHLLLRRLQSQVPSAIHRGECVCVSTLRGELRSGGSSSFLKFMCLERSRASNSTLKLCGSRGPCSQRCPCRLQESGEFRCPAGSQTALIAGDAQPRGLQSGIPKSPRVRLPMTGTPGKVVWTQTMPGGWDLRRCFEVPPDRSLLQIRGAAAGRV